MIKIIPFECLSYKDKQCFFKFLEDESTDTTNPASVNMWQADWKTQQNTLPYKLSQGLFNNPKGVLFVGFDDSKIIGCSGAYVSTFTSQLLIAGTRTWVNSEYRNQQIPREYFLPAQKQWAIDNNLKAIALTFNDYNKNIIETFKRNRLGEVRSKREPHHLFYNGVNEVLFPVTIQHTKQFVIYEKLAEWDFNWESIRFVDNNPT